MQMADDLASERDLLQVAADGLRHELSNVRQQLAEQQVMLCHLVSVGELDYNLCQRRLSSKAGHTSLERLVLSIPKQIKGVACSLETSTGRFLLIYTKSSLLWLSFVGHSEHTA